MPSQLEMMRLEFVFGKMTIQKFTKLLFFIEISNSYSHLLKANPKQPRNILVFGKIGYHKIIEIID